MYVISNGHNYIMKRKDDLQPVSDDETWCEAAEASVVCSGESYYRHHWKIDEFEV